MVGSHRFTWALVAAMFGAAASRCWGDDHAPTDLASSNSEAGDAEPAMVEVQLTDDGLFKRDLVFWPGTEDLLYTVEAPDGTMRIVRRSARDGSTVNFNDESKLSDRELAVSSDGQVFAYNSVRGLSSRIHVVDRRADRRLTVPKMGRHDWSNWPSVSPDGARLVYVEGAKILYLYDLEKGRGERDIVRLTPESIGPGSDYFPRFTPDGGTILFASTRDQDFEIYAMQGDGTAQRRLTFSPGVDLRPVCSPDGTSICFTSNRDGNYEIYVMDAEGGAARRVTNNPERDDFAIWSADGTQLVYVSERNGRFDIYRRLWR